jgi:hypothetical protein
MFLDKALGRLLCSHCARPTRAFCEVIGASWRTGGGRVRTYALREQESLADALPDFPDLLDYSIFRRKKVGHSKFQRYQRNVPTAIRLHGSYGWLCADERWAR